MPWFPAALLPLSFAGAAGWSGGGWRARPSIVVLGLFLVFFSLANKDELGSRSAVFSCLVPRTRVPDEGSAVGEQILSGGGSHAGESMPYPWWFAASAAGASFSPSYFLCYMLRVEPTLASGAGASSSSSSCCYPRWMVAVGGGSDEKLSNKLVGWLDRAVVATFSSSSPCRRGGGRRGQDGDGAGALRSCAPWGVQAGVAAIRFSGAASTSAAGATDQTKKYLRRALRVARVVRRVQEDSPAISYAPFFNLRLEALSSCLMARFWSEKVAYASPTRSPEAQGPDCVFVHLSKGLLCIREGHGCNFLFLSGPFCSIVTLLI